tara:strand:+ start:96 stop:641 length:546 start_codon:yes stop_codon:yes gene_type:complete
MKVGYARVSSLGQNLQSQLDALKEHKVELIFSEKVSGTSTKGREQLKEMLNFVREGDEIVFTRTDRIARSVLDLQLIVKELTEKGVSLTATEQPISTKDATSKCFLDMLSVFAEFETNLRKERQLDGIKANLHKFKGRGQTIDIAKIQKLKEEGKGATDIAKEMGIDRTSVYRLLKRVEVK